MARGRNDPCPCGSGKKYKRCCWQKDRRLGTARRRPEDPLPDGLPGEWELDLVPTPILISDEPAARPAVLLVTAAGFVLHTDLITNPPTEMEDVVALLADGVRVAAERAGRPPIGVTVRYSQIAEPLFDRLVDEGVSVDVSPVLPGLDGALMSLRQSMGIPPKRHTSPAPDTWAGWGLPSDLIAELFRAAAAYYRAAPWKLMANEQILLARTKAGNEWVLSVLGEAGETFGLALNADIRDLWAMFEAHAPEDAFDVLHGAAVVLWFLPGHEQPSRTRREVKAAGWELADRRAYPDLSVVNTPGGSISRAQAGDLIDLLHAVPRLIAAHEAVFASSEPPTEALVWSDPDTGVTLRYTGTLGLGEEVTWPRPGALATCTATGPNAEPEAALDDFEDLDELADDEAAFVERFEAWLRALGRAESTVERHTANASLFVEGFLAQHQEVPVCAVTEYDVRMFLFEWYPRKVFASPSDARALPTSLGRFFDYLHNEEGISCPWAADVLRDKDTFMARWESCPSQFWSDEGVGLWRGHVYADLDARVLCADPHLGRGVEWGATMGFEEAMLEREGQRRWLLWRDEIIGSATTAPDEIRAELVRRQRKWARTPQQALSGKTPLQVIKAERRESARRQREGPEW